jgi:hypothetical protein
MFTGTNLHEKTRFSKHKRINRFHYGSLVLDSIYKVMIDLIDFRRGFTVLVVNPRRVQIYLLFPVSPYL